MVKKKSFLHKLVTVLRMKWPPPPSHPELANVSTDKKDNALELMAKNLVRERKNIIRANQKDIAESKKKKLSQSLIDRLTNYIL